MGHVRAPSVGDQTDIVAKSRCDQGFDLDGLARIDDEIGKPSGPRILDGVNLLLAVAVAVSETNLRIVADRIVGPMIATLPFSSRSMRSFLLSFGGWGKVRDSLTNASGHLWEFLGTPCRWPRRWIITEAGKRAK